MVKKSKEDSGNWHKSDPLAREKVGAGMGLHPFETRFAAVIDSPYDFRSCALAVRTLSECITQSAAIYTSRVASEWPQEAQSFSKHMNELAKSNKSLVTVDDEIGSLSVYGPFAKRTNASMSSTKLGEINAGMGLILLYNYVAARTLQATMVTAWTRLQRCGTPRLGRHPDWEDLANNFPKTISEVGDWLAKATEPDMLNFLAALKLAMDFPLPRPSELLSRPISSKAAGIDSSGARQGRDPIDADHENDRELPDPPQSYVGWLIQRANQAGHLSHFGLQDKWEKQTPYELSHVCKGIAAALTGGMQEQQFALFACLSLETSLPANLLVNVKLKPNADLWVDFKQGCIHWCILRFLNLELAKSIDPMQVARHHIADIWMPELAHKVAKELGGLHPDALNVIEFITGNSDEEFVIWFLDRYRVWLTSLGAESLHRVYDARFARSFGQIYRMQANDSIAAINALEFEECAMGMLHYVTISRAFLYQQTASALNTVGLGHPVCPPELEGSVGPQSAMEFDEFIRGLINLRAHRDAAMQAMCTSTDLATCTDAFNKLTHCDQLLELSLSGGRDQHFQRQTWGQVQAHQNYMLKNDKDVDEFSKCRAIPIHKALRHVLSSHAEAIALFSRKVEQLGAIARSPRGRGFDDRSPHRVFFVAASLVEAEGRIYLARAGMDVSCLQELSSKFLNGKVNVGRHSIISKAATTTVDPWLWKCLTGHHRGHAEPFSDGQCVSPENALQALEKVLDELFLPFSTSIGRSVESGVLEAQDFSGRLPSSSTDTVRTEVSRSRVLPAPFDGYTLLALRVIDHLAQLLRTGQGPSHLQANLLLNLLITNWILFSDLKILWSASSPFLELSSYCASAVWNRPDCRSEIRVGLTPSTLFSIGDLGSTRLAGSWDSAASEARKWLNSCMPNLAWPEVGNEAISRLSALMVRWLRFNLPPFQLAAASPKLTTPTVGRSSIIRILESPTPFGNCHEILVFPRPKPRGKGNLRKSKSKLQQAVDLIHEYADPSRHQGEDWALMGELSGELGKIDCSSDLSASVIIDWGQREAALWVGSQADRIQVSSMSTYLYLLAPALNQIRPIHNFRESPEEWLHFVEVLRKPPGIKVEDNGDAQISARLTAAKRLLGKLQGAGYEIPAGLLDNSRTQTSGGMRKSAASILILQEEGARLRALMTEYFSQDPLESALAELYVDLRLHVSLRSIECAVLPLDGLDVFNRLVITTDGFSHLKSENARRFETLPIDLANNYRRLCAAVLAAAPDAEWLYLMDDRSDWRFVVQLEKAFSAALKQVSRDQQAVPHSTRSTAPLNTVVPEWEAMTRGMLTGSTTPREYSQFSGILDGADFTRLAQTLLKIGHGHGVTYLMHYFSLWDLVRTFQCQSRNFDEGELKKLTAKRRPQYMAALIKAKQRRGPDFNGLQWLISKELEHINLPAFTCDLPPAIPNASGVGLSPASKSTPLRYKVGYLAARFANLIDISAAHAFHLDTNTAAELETLFSSSDAVGLTARHQAKISDRGRKAEIAYLTNTAGKLLIRHLLRANKEQIEQFGDALTPRRTYMAVAPSLSTIQSNLTSYLNFLPIELGLLIQFSPGRFPTDVLEMIGKSSSRITVGQPDPDLGARPRLSVVDSEQPLNLVTRARRTSSTRCVIAAINLLNQQTTRATK